MGAHRLGNPDIPLRRSLGDNREPINRNRVDNVLSLPIIFPIENTVFALVMPRDVEFENKPYRRAMNVERYELRVSREIHSLLNNFTDVSPHHHTIAISPFLSHLSSESLVQSEDF